MKETLMTLLKKSNLKSGMWVVLGHMPTDDWGRKTYLSARHDLFDYRNGPTCAEYLQWYSQDRNPYKIKAHRISKMNPVSYKDEYGSRHILIKHISHAFESHTEFIQWRNDFLKKERQEIKTLHQEARNDKKFWDTRKAELAHWGRLDDINKIRKIR
jgi:hypothetical protein|tara:strand:- start:2213 stop:2683 length:471 start_codon:yes stop_codon:yes gene_type:complete